MMSKMRKTKGKKSKLLALVLMLSMILGCLSSGMMNPMSAFAAVKTDNKETSQQANETKAEEKQSNQAVDKTKPVDQVDLRFVFTTDLHGMVSSMDYIAGTDFGNKGLSKAYNLLQLTRSEKEASNVFTLDVGDVLFDASMEYILDQDDEAIQPIYQAMALVGYDAITLGNHDFDYGKDYLLAQLQGSGLINKVVVSNLMNAKDGSYPFHKNMIIEREAVTKKGEKVTVKVGIIGETIPTLSPKTDNYAGVWKTEDIVVNVAKEVADLRGQGADVVVALVHSGFGDVAPELNATNVSYALTKISGLDAIFCGHEHNEFPSKRTLERYFEYPGVDRETGLVNDKLIVMAGDQGKSIGVADFSISVDGNGAYKVVSQKGSVRNVADYKLEENEDILACFNDWKEELEAYRTNEVIKLSKDVVIQNYMGLLEDTVAMQLQNDARIAYARKYIEENVKEYAGYPVIAAASHISYGANSSDDFVNISGSMSLSDMFRLQNYRHYTCIYKITGAQLKEWLELSASAYTNLSKNKDVTQLLLEDEWMNNWKNFYVFDGIEYTISPYVDARYNAEGKRISNSRRVKNITYNGKDVTDDMEFIIATNSLTSAGPMFTWAPNQLIRGFYRTQVLISEFLQGIKNKDDYTPVPDYNWSIDFNNNQKFLIRTSPAGDTFAAQHEWYKKTLLKTDEFNLYEFAFTQKKKTVEPYIVVRPGVLDPTSGEYDVYVDAFSTYGIKKLLYSANNVPENSTVWIDAQKVSNNKFKAFFNGDYTIFAEDNAGNRSVYHIVIDNIGSKDIAAPRVWSFNNRKTSVTGKAEPGCTVIAKIGNKEYKTQALSTGNFTISVPGQVSGAVFTVYAKDEKNNRVSSEVKVRVKKNGPNQLTVNAYSNVDDALTGKTNDDNSIVYAVVPDTRTIYVSKHGGLDLFLSSGNVSYDNYSIEEVEEEVDKDGNYRMILPDIQAGSAIKVFNMDIIGQISLGASVTVKAAGPYSPTIYDLNDVEKVIYGNVKTTSKNTILDVVIYIDYTKYTTVTDSNGNFTLSLSKPLTQGTVISAHAIDHVDGKAKKGRESTTEVKSFNTLKLSDELEIAPLSYNSKQIKISYIPYYSVIVAIPYDTGVEFVTKQMDDEGNAVINLRKTLQEGSNVRVVNRNNLCRLVDAATAMVMYKAPEQPVLISEITNIHKYLKVVTKTNCSVYATIGDTTYESVKGVYKKDQNGYVHTITIPKADSGTIVSIWARNVIVDSKKVNYMVVKKAPDTPKVDPIVYGSKQITGTVEVFLFDSEEQATVKNSKTKVFAKINGKNYAGKIDKDGKFTITVPVLIKGTQIKVYAYNLNGYGPILVIE